tara:strand:- start:202 stop:348 length:147 start_codon:yes stop_codon:yes gene_type:complete
MRNITNIKLPQPEYLKGENNLWNKVDDNNGTIISIDRNLKKQSKYCED